MPPRRPHLPRALRAGLVAAASCGLVAGLSPAPGPAAATPATTADVTGVLPTVGAATPYRPGGTGRALAADDGPLSVTIDRLTPSSRTQGEPEPVVVTGRVTNVDDVAWTTISLYPVLGGGVPITTEDDLAIASASAPDTYIGDRELAYSDETAALSPGESYRYRIRVPAGALPTTTPGVYWFGVHALGSSEEQGADEFADGRARTFLPLVPGAEPEDAADGTAGTAERPGIGALGLQRAPVDGPVVDTALVLPLRHYIGYRADGSLNRPNSWQASLARGRLREVLRLAAGAGGAPLTWLVDPALPDAVQHLARGNPARSLAPTLPPEDGENSEDGEGGDEGESPGETPSDGASPGDDGGSTDETPSDDGSGEEEPEVETVPGGATARIASSWLDELEFFLGGNEVLPLPYGDVDVPALLEHDPDLFRLALDRPGRVLPSWGHGRDAVVAPPSGVLDTASLETLPRGTTVLLDDTSFGTGTATPPVLDDGTHTVIAASSAASSAATGESSAGDADDPVALRQRILSEAALRLLDATEGGDGDAAEAEAEPLVVTLPDDLSGRRSGAFFAGLDVDWMRLTDLDGIEAAAAPVDLPGGRADGDDQADDEGDDEAGAGRGPGPDEGLVYPAREVAAETSSTTVDAARELVDAGGVLQNLLTRNDAVAGVIADEALCGVSYSARERPETSLDELVGAGAWVERRLGSVTIDAPPGVTLSSASGDFASTITNGLDEPVTIGVTASTDSGVVVSLPDPVELGPGSRTTVLLQAEADEVATHNVTLQLIDSDGELIGSSDTVAVRSAQVSNVIWLIIGTGIGLLALAIVIRLVRRFRGRGDDAEPPTEPVDEPADERSPATSPSAVEASG